MADEPNKRMDEVLKAYADKRRQEAALELHPATRQMLQGEVARTYKQPSRASWLQRMILFWPRIAFAAACVAITLTLVLIIQPRERMMEIAQTTRPADNEEAEQIAPSGFADAPSPSTAPAMPGKQLDNFAKNEADGLKAKSEIADARKDVADVKLMREEIVPKETVARQSFANSADPSRARYTQQKQDVQLGAKLANVQAVLNNFELEQRGSEIKITDEDGSIYIGNVISQDEAKKRYFRAQNVPQRPQNGVAGPGEPQMLFYAFGTNVSLKQEVSIEANILQVTNAVTVPGLAPSSKRLNEPQNRRGGAVPQQTIQGRAKVGTNQEVLINAVPSQP
jgi:hypothetical protein